jgi:uncharacterized membrane protein YcaP (DUF421 family)
MKELFFKDWDSIGRVAIGAVLSFITLFVFVRISGKRTLANLNAFDFVVTVALGSTLSFTILAEVSLAEGATALIMIIIMQYALAWTAKISERFGKVINSHPTLLFYDGKFIQTGLTREVVTEEEVYSQARKYGIESMDSVRAVVMELNGEITVIKKSFSTGVTSLDGLDIAHIQEKEEKAKK